MCDKAIEDIQQSREPWLAVSLSWLIPGFGQFYANRYARGVIFITLAGFFYIFWFASLMSTKCSIIPSIAINLFGSIILPAFICLDAFKITRGANTAEFETDRVLSKDPWLATFLSLLLPGLGHAYLRKGFFFILYIVVFLWLRILSIQAVYAFIALHLFRVFVCIHAYFALPIRREQKNNIIITFAVLLIFVQCFNGIFMPWMTPKYLVEFNPSIGSCMEPTIKNNDKIIINKLAYAWEEPEIGDIVVFAVPENTRTVPGVMSGKRVVAIGGETVQVKDGQIYVNGKKRKFKVPKYFGEGSKQTSQIEGEKMHDLYLNFGVAEPYLVPEDDYFLLGDNIENSVDSRCFGAVHKEDIVGKVTKIYWPLQRIGTLY